LAEEQDMVTWCIPRFSVATLEPAELPMLILVRKMLRWLIPHLPIQASTLAVKSKTVVVDMALDSWNCAFLLTGSA